MVLKEMIAGIEGVYFLKGNSKEQYWLAVVSPKRVPVIPRKGIIGLPKHNFNFKTVFVTEDGKTFVEIRMDNKTVAGIFGVPFLACLPPQELILMRVDSDFILKESLTTAFTVLVNSSCTLKTEISKTEDTPSISDILE